MSLVTSVRAPSAPAITTRSSRAARRVPRSSAPSRLETDQSVGVTSVKCVRSQDPRASQANCGDTVWPTVANTYPLFERV